MIIIKLLLLALLIFQARLISAADYDFFIDFSECKSTVGYLVLSNESLKTLPADPAIMECKRISKIVNCDFTFKNDQKGHKGNSEKYEVVIDSPPFLHLSSKTGSEYIAINTTQHAATITTRIVHEKFLGAKVCQGIYATDFEMKSMRK